MDYEQLLSAEMVTAFAVFLGALFGGIVAVIAELRKPTKPAADAPSPVTVVEATESGTRDVITAIEEETDHVNRTLWVIEKKLTEHLHRIERAVLSRGQPDG